MKKVLSPTEKKNGGTYWLKIGRAFVNKDGSTNVYLDAYPTNGKLQIRDMDERDFQKRDGRASDSDNDNQLPF